MIYLERRKKVRLTSEIWAVGLPAGLYYLQVPYTLTNILTNIKNEFESNQQNQIRIQFGSASSNETGSGTDPEPRKTVRSAPDPLPPLVRSKTRQCRDSADNKKGIRKLLCVRQPYLHASPHRIQT